MREVPMKKNGIRKCTRTNSNRQAPAYKADTEKEEEWEAPRAEGKTRGSVEGTKWKKASLEKPEIEAGRVPRVRG